ncbi:MAG: hypothetical protein B7Z37_20155 [Verrucomicrobia bacterium 12-59-8]|nr:MAG: hypothetical protein B7Z37_20155 [Verrucomicrobia bacterium 12-59-8]
MHFTPDTIEASIIVIVRWLKLGVEVFGAGLVTLGVCMAIVHLIRTLAASKSAEFTTTRLILARHLALALEFELGADILGTAISPDWDQIGKLGVVAVIRTGLNFFLSMEMKGARPVEKDESKLMAQAQRGELRSCAALAETTTKIP